MVAPTTTKVIIDNDYVKLFYHTDTGVVHHVLGENMRSEDLHEVLNTGIDVLVAEGAFKWLSDNRGFQETSEEDTNWINTNWLPRAVEAGWKYWALVVPQTVKARINMQEFVQTFFEKGVRIMVFTEPDEAMEWLVDVDK